MDAHYDVTARFERSFGDLDARKRSAFLAKLEEFVEDLKATPLGSSPKFRPGLRIHPVDRKTDPVTLDVGGHEIYR